MERIFQALSSTRKTGRISEGWTIVYFAGEPRKFSGSVLYDRALTVKLIDRTAQSAIILITNR